MDKKYQTTLKSIRINGFKSIKEQKIDLKKLNVLIGANGSGKSNFVSFFKMIHYLAHGDLQLFIGKSGFSNSILYYGVKTTPQMQSELHFLNNQNIEGCYKFRLTDAVRGSMIFNEESIFYKRPGWDYQKEIVLGSGHNETMLKEKAVNVDNKTERVILSQLWGINPYQFHDTSNTSFIRNTCYVNDNNYLRNDAGNLAAILYLLLTTEPGLYSKIRDIIRLAAPFFDDFILKPTEENNSQIVLDWKEKNNEYKFGPHQISDGLIRFMALTALFNLPEKLMPNTIIIDEPELGLHPYAMELLATMIQRASKDIQVVLATQSESLVDLFELDDIIVVSRSNDQSIFKSLSRQDYEIWLNEEYTISELWNKNVFSGGRPSR